MTPRPLQIFGLFAGAYFLSYFYRAANAVIAGDLARDLALSAAQLGLMTSLFYVTFALIQLPLGSSLDRLGPRWVTPTLMLVGALGSLIFASAETFAVLALGRALIGIGMAGILMGALKAFAYWFSPARFATVSGLLMGTGASGALVAATPLAWLNVQFGWRAVFLWSSLVIVISALSILFWTRNAPPGRVWGSGEGQASLGEVFHDLRFWRIAPLTLFLAGTLLSVQTLWGGPYLADVWGLSPIEVGNLLIFMALGVAAGYLLSGWLADRFGLTRIVIVSASLFILTQLLLAFEAQGVLGFIYFAFGFCGAGSVLLFAHTRSIFPAALTGRAITAINLFGIGGSALLQWLMGVIISAFAADSLGRYPPGAYSVAFLFTASGGLLALLWYLPLGKR